MNDRDKKKKVSPGAIVAIIVALLAAETEVFVSILGFVIIAAIFASPFLIIYFVMKNKGRSASGKPARPQRKETFDDCPRPFCFHRDKGEHHVRRGREIDPWDRPDIDISKYQRRQ